MPNNLDFFRKKVTDPKELEALKNKYKLKEVSTKPIQVAQYDLDGNFITVRPSMNTIVESKHYTSDANIKLCINHIQTKAHGFIWIKVDELPETIPTKINPPKTGNWNINDILNINKETSI